MYSCTVHLENIVFKAEKKIEMFLGQNKFKRRMKE